MPHQQAAYISGVASNSPRAGLGSRRSSKAHSASSSTLTSPVREAVSTTPNTSAAISAAAQFREMRFSSNSPMVATQDHMNTLLRWLGWRKLPTARPG